MESDPNAVKHKIRGHLVFLTVALLGGGWFVLRGTCGGSSVDDAGKVAAGITGFVAVAHLLLALCAPLRPSLQLLLALLIVCLAPIGFLYPVFTRPAEGWPVNPGRGLRVDENPSSRVITPGDSVRVCWTPDGVESVGALWSGTPKVEVINATEVGCPKVLPATGRSESWDRVIWTEDYLQECPPFLTAKFRIPNGEQFVGKTLKFQITLPFSYPAPQGVASYVDKKKTVVRRDDIVLTSPAIKDAYWTTWKWGATFGMTGTVVGGLMLAFFAFGLRGSGGFAAQPEVVRDNAEARAERLASVMG